MKVQQQAQVLVDAMVVVVDMAHVDVLFLRAETTGATHQSLSVMRLQDILVAVAAMTPHPLDIVNVLHFLPVVAVAVSLTMEEEGGGGTDPLQHGALCHL